MNDHDAEILRDHAALLWVIAALKQHSVGMSDAYARAGLRGAANALAMLLRASSLVVDSLDDQVRADVAAALQHQLGELVGRNAALLAADDEERDRRHGVDDTGYLDDALRKFFDEQGGEA
ncbi:hypothetical protein BRW65_03915 [Mycobacterium paraffinicum]|uniref:Uncharacterized protein n=1 Tax=Mycobacterium paraffinicum TaxID=53378 RepID=A0A1Q4I156_9MYCO|nr:hypothetical protein [Mycobacterium paraffinicum]OJZ75691.1 hypothetical protein BRW65_03915 [Mycobacterium paraffinicum]